VHTGLLGSGNVEAIPEVDVGDLQDEGGELARRRVQRFA